VATLGAGDDGKSFAVGEFGGLDDRTDADRIDRDYRRTLDLLGLGGNDPGAE
jgi:hypothetical protein